MKRGQFIVVDGVDGAGKGTIVSYLGKKFARSRKVFDLRNYEKRTGLFPQQKEWKDASVILSAEPTFALVGKIIREDLIRHGSRAHPKTIAEAFALDRWTLYNAVILPALRAGKTVVQERSVTTSLVQNPLQGKGVTRKWVQQIPGNVFALKHAPDLVIITSVDPKIAMQRISRRSKKDDSYYEQLSFQKKVSAGFHSAWFHSLLKQYGSKVVYVDTSRTVQESYRVVDKLFLWKR